MFCLINSLSQFPSSCIMPQYPWALTRLGETCAPPCCLSVLLFMWFNACPKCTHVLKVHLKEQKCVTTHLRTSWSALCRELSAAELLPKNVHSHSQYMLLCTSKNPTFTQQHKPHKRGLPMRQMRSERSHIKQPNLSCFVFIAPVHFHNALKPPLRRDMERRGWRHTEKQNTKEQGQETFSK